MKHLRTELDRLLLEAGISGKVSDDARDEMLHHLAWLLETNKSLNLTAVSEPESALRLHVVDSLLSIDAVNRAPAGAMLDIGTGGGYPGLPLALATGRQTLLLDSVAKKVRALEGFLRADDLSLVTTSSLRAEVLAAERRATYAVVVARAVSSLPALVELASPLLMRGGHLIAMKGQPDKEEIARGDAVARLCGMSRGAIREYELPDGAERRCVIEYELVRSSSVRLPRRVGLAQNSPLA